VERLEQRRGAEWPPDEGGSTEPEREAAARLPSDEVVEEFDLLSLLEVHLVTRNESDTRLRSRELLLTAHCRKDSGNSEGGLLTFRLHRFPHLSTFCLY